MARTRIMWSKTMVEDVANMQNVRMAVAKATDATAARANALSAGFRTGLYHRDHKSPAVGNTQPKYASALGESKRKPAIPVGLVYTGNYAAMKDNAQNNTLLKARG